MWLAMTIYRGTRHTQCPARGSQPNSRGEMFGHTYHTSSSAGGGFRGMPRISEAFFWISSMVCACSNRRRNLAFSLRSCSFSTATSSRRRPLGPRGLDSALSVPSRRARRHWVNCEEYNTSRRSRAPTSPGARQASASYRTRNLYRAVNRRRSARAGTSGSGLLLPFSPISILDTISPSPLRPIYDIKPGGGVVSLDIGT